MDLETVPDALHYNSWIADRALAFLERAERPFMLFVSTPDPHDPFSLPRPWADLFDPADMPEPLALPGELERMPDYVRARLPADWIDNEAPPVEQDGMTVTHAVSPAKPRPRRGAHQRHGGADRPSVRAGAVEAGRHGHCRRDLVVLFTSDHGEFLRQSRPAGQGAAALSRTVPRQLRHGGIGHSPGPAHIGGEQPSGPRDRPCWRAPASTLDAAGTDGQSLAPVLRGDGMEGRLRFLEFHCRIDRHTYNRSIDTVRWRLTLYPESGSG